MWIYILLGVLVLVGVVNIIVSLKTRHESKLSENDKNDIIKGFNNYVGIISQTLTESQKIGNNAVVESMKTFQDHLSRNHQALEIRILELIRQLDERMQNISQMQEAKLESIRQSNEKQIKSLQEDNNKQLDKMRETVDEKLSKTINDRFDQSFKVLSEQLENVYKSIGEMQNIASDVGSLTRMLSNVKTTGIFGEIQLGAIIEQMLKKINMKPILLLLMQMIRLSLPSNFLDRVKMILFIYLLTQNSHLQFTATCKMLMNKTILNL